MKKRIQHPLLRLALASWILFGFATLIGLRKYVCVLSFTSPDGGPIGMLDELLMIVYVMSFALATTVAPICLVAFGLEKGWQSLRK